MQVMQKLKLWGFNLFWQSPNNSHGNVIYRRSFIIKINPSKNCFFRGFAIKDKTIHKKKKVTCKWNVAIEMEIIICEVKKKDLKALKLDGQDK